MASSASSVGSSSFQREMKAGRPIYWYQTTPPSIVLEGFDVLQKGRKFYVLKGKAVDIDRLCRVPVLPYDQPNAQIALWALSPQAGQWQRELSMDRIADLGVFFGALSNFLVNS